MNIEREAWDAVEKERLNYIDKAKLLSCLKKEVHFCIKEKFNEKKTRFHIGRETALTDIIRQIESGTFDIQAETP